mgnify:CR=1 FL=1
MNNVAQTTNDIKNGSVLNLDGQLWTVMKFQHVKPGKGGAFVRYKIRDLKSGRVIDQTCNAGTKFENVQLITKEMQYLYNDGDSFYFMDNETYEQIPISKDTLGDDFRFVKENENVKVLSYKGSVFAVEPPLFVELEITETEPGVKGNTATNVLKPATVETGAVVKVPIFIEQGERIQIDTRTGEYLGRSKK